MQRRCGCGGDSKRAEGYKSGRFQRDLSVYARFNRLRRLVFGLWLEYSFIERKSSKSVAMAAPPPLPSRPPPSSLPPGARVASECSPVDREPPPVPTTPRPSLVLPPSSSYSPTALPQDSLGSPDDRLTISRLIREYSDRFPLQVTVVKGFYGDRGEDSAIAADESYNIHFVKRAKVVTIRDVVGNTHIVPLNSACRFGLVYLKPGSSNPVVQTFDTVEQILKADPLPQVVAAKADYRGENKKSSVSKGEVLIINGTHKRLGIGKVQLKVFSLSTLEEKLLSKDCIGLFTTEPYHVQMYLPELLEHIPNLFRSKARLYLDYDEDNRQGLPDYLISEVITFVKQYVETSVIASQVNEDEEPDPFKSVQDEDKPEHFLDIPESLDIELEIVDPNEHDYMDILYETTDNLLRGYDRTLSYSYVAHDQMFTAVRKGHEKTGQYIETPRLLSCASGHDRPTEEVHPQPNGSDVNDIGDYVDIDDEIDLQRPEPTGPPKQQRQSISSDDSPPLSAPPPVPARKPKASVTRSASMQVHPSTYENLEIANSPSEQPQTPPRKVSLKPLTLPKPSPPTKEGASVLKSKVGQAEDKQSVAATESKPTLPHADSKAKSGSQGPMRDLQDEVAQLRDSVEQLTLRIMELEKKKIAERPPTPSNSLATLSVDQVLKLLDQMGMQKYKEKFSYENIDGELLSECDEPTLQAELGVVSRLDRIKIMKLISGKQSALDVLQGRGTYVLFELKTDK